MSEMEDAIKWSTHPGGEGRFLIADSLGTRLRYCERTSFSGKALSYNELVRLEKLPDFTTFDWAQSDNHNLVALGTILGDVSILQIHNQSSSHDFLQAYPIKQQRECTSVVFNSGTLLAVGLKKHRTDAALNLFDYGDSSGTTEPFRRLANGDAVTNVQFFADEQESLLAGISGKGIRWYDLRDPNPAGATLMTTRQCHHIAINPINKNYFASAGPPGESTVSIWDRRFFPGNSGMSFTSTLPSTAAVLEINNAVDSRAHSSIRSLHFSPNDSTRFAALSSIGQLRVFDIGRHPSASVDDPPSYTAGNEEYDNSFPYLKRSYDLLYHAHAKHGPSRSVAFDFVCGENSSNGDSIVSLRKDGTVELIPISPVPAAVRVSPLGDIMLQVQSKACTATPFKKGNIAEDLLAIQAKVHSFVAAAQGGDASFESPQQNGITFRDTKGYTAVDSSSREQHERLLNFGFPAVALDLAESLTLTDVQRRRCEEGYLFDCEKNKEIVKNDAWLVSMWDVVNQIDILAQGLAANAKTRGLAFAGVNSIWLGSLARQYHVHNDHPNGKQSSSFDTVLHNYLIENGYSEYQDVPTEFPHRRKLGLILCGWLFDEQDLHEKCREILMRGEPYKAIVVAFCHGRKKVAIEMIKLASRSGVVQNSGLAAVIAVDNVSKEQRSLCEWMAEDATDPYLKALLTYFITGEWKSIAEMAQLPLRYRVAVALQHLEDATLGTFLRTTTEETIRQGDVEGILLTGIGPESMDLFQNYIDKTGDLQTGVLVNAFAATRLADDERWKTWKENYFSNMQSWRTFIQRTRFTVQHSRRTAAMNDSRLISPSPRQVTLRCMHCQKSIAKDDVVPAQPKNTTATSKQPSPSALPQAARLALTPASASGTICPRCGRHLPRCAICMLWLGTPDASVQVGAGQYEDELGLSRFMNFCMECGHGYHANHGREWFAKHQDCPMPNCNCRCAARR